MNDVPSTWKTFVDHDFIIDEAGGADEQVGQGRRRQDHARRVQAALQMSQEGLIYNKK